MATILQMANLSKSFGSKAVIRDLSFTLEAGSIGCLLGSSGCGKTTALRTIAGFETGDRGRIIIAGRVMAGDGYQVPPEERGVGMVFQDYALFPHLTASGNIGFGLRGMNTMARKDRIAELLEVVGLADAADRFPHELSGGQQQRVALARALAPRPKFLLLDEPFSNLDVALRERLSLEVRQILKRYDTSALMVTHNQFEAFAMADMIGVMHRGRLEQWASAYELYHRPITPYVADFIGEGVLLAGSVTGDRRVETGLGTLRGRFSYPCHDGCTAKVLIRPEDIVHDHASRYKARIVKRNFRGPNILYTLQLPTQEQVLSLVPSHHNHCIGEEIGIVADVEDIILFGASAETTPLQPVAYVK